LKLSYQLIGNSKEKSVICLHGFLESNDMWKEGCLDDLLPQFVLVQLPGHCSGEALLQEGLTITDIAIRVISIIDELGIENFDIVGHSLGGYIAIEVCKLKPTFGKLILLNSNFWADSESKKQDRLRIAELVETKLTGFIMEVIPNLFQQRENCRLQITSIIEKAKMLCPKNVAILTMAMKDRNDNTEWVKENQNNILFIQGEKDTVMPTIISTQVCSENGIEFIEISNSGHMSAYENTKDLNVILRKTFNS
jgi:pimeloyl-ACP methyl ester carboxylesterase